MQHHSLLARSLGAGLATLSLAALVLAQSPVAPDAITVKDAPSTVLAGFQTSRATMQDLSLPSAPVAGLELDVHMGGKVYELILREHDVRASNFQLIVADANGLHAVPKPANTTYRGVVTGYPESAIAASLVDGQLTAMVQLAPTAAAWNIQPLTTVVKSADRATHVMHSSADNTVPQHQCGTGNPLQMQSAVSGGGTTSNANGLVEAEIACDADYDDYILHGSNVSQTQNDITGIINACTVIYKRDVSVEFKITQIIVRTIPTYTTNDYSQLLGQYRARWLGSHGNVPRDISHLFTGKNRTTSVIGVAYLRGVCNLNTGYGLSFTHFTSNFTSRVGLTAHELGHSFGANHCSGSACYIMCAGLGGCGRSVTQFGTASQSAINSYIASVGCLSPIQQNPPIVSSLTPNVSEAFRGTTIKITGQKFTGAMLVSIGGDRLTPGTDPLKHFTLVSDTEIRFQAPTQNVSLTAKPVTVTTPNGTSLPQNLSFKHTDPPKLDAFDDANRGQPMLWEFGVGAQTDRWILAISATPTTFNVLGMDWLTTPVVIAAGSVLTPTGYGFHFFSPVPLTAPIGTKFYSQVVTLSQAQNLLTGNTNVDTTTIR